jgi:hypothetical protein
MMSAADYLEANYIPELNTGCWLWIGTMTTNGTALATFDGHSQTAARLAWKTWRGYIPRGLEVGHRCGITRCINPDHLWLGTKSQLALNNKTIIERLSEHSVVDVRTGCIIWVGRIGKHGYGCLDVDGKVQYVHRLIWKHTHGKIPRFMFVCHRCDTPTCLNIDHLFLGTAADNSHDCMSKGRDDTHGLVNLGIMHPNSKLTDEQIADIRKRAAASSKRGVRAQLAREYGITRSNVSIIVLRQGWKHLP